MAMAPVLKRVSFTRRRVTIGRFGSYPALGGDRYLLAKGGFELLRHADQVGERFGLRFLHEVCAMGLDG